jgi:hypothetical protein
MQEGGAPKSLYRIKELQDKLAAIKELIKREQSNKTRHGELIQNL